MKEFSKFGALKGGGAKAVSVRNKDQKCFAFIDFEEPTAAAAAISASLDHQIIMQSKRVQARPAPAQPSTSFPPHPCVGVSALLRTAGTAPGLAVRSCGLVRASTNFRPVCGVVAGGGKAGDKWGGSRWA